MTANGKKPGKNDDWLVHLIGATTIVGLLVGFGILFWVITWPDK